MVAYTYTRTTQAGWLNKESAGGFGRKTFHRRWFVLKGTELRYFKTEEDPIPHGVIDLNFYMAVTNDATCKKSPYAFCLKPRTKDYKSYLIFADTQEEMTAWMKALQTRVGDRVSDSENSDCDSEKNDNEGNKSVLDKWLDRMDLCSPSFETARSKIMSPTNSTFSKTSSELDSKHHLRSYKSNSSLSSSNSISSTDSSIYSGSTNLDSDGELNYKEKARQQLKDKVIRTTSLPPISREKFNESVVTSIPSSPTEITENIASRRNINLPPLPLPTKGIIFTMESNQVSPFIQAPAKSEKWESERARRRRSNSVPRFDCFKIGAGTGCVTPTFGNGAF